MRALILVFEQSMERWAMGVADFRNAHFKREEGAWTLDDFVTTSRTSHRKRQQALQSREMQALKRAEKRQIHQIKSGQFDDSFLPAGIRMTDEERAARQRR